MQQHAKDAHTESHRGPSVGCRYEGTNEASTLLLQMEVDALTRRNANLMDKVKEMEHQQSQYSVLSDGLTSSDNQGTNLNKQIITRNDRSTTSMSECEKEDSEESNSPYSSGSSGSTVPYGELSPDKRVAEAVERAILRERARHSEDMLAQQEKFENIEKSLSRAAQQMESTLLDRCDSTVRRAVSLIDATNLVLIEFLSTVTEVRQRLLFQEQKEFILIIQRITSKVEKYKWMKSKAVERVKYVRPMIDPVELCLSSWAETGVVNL